MKGTRPLDNDEIRLVSACFTGTFEVRNRGLFMLGVSTGGRISELLSLTIGDVYQNGPRSPISSYDRSIVKGGEVSRAVPVNTDGMRAIDELVRWHREQYRTVKASRPLFPSSKRQRKATHDAKGGTQRAKRRFRGCWTQRAPRNPFFAQSRLRKGCTSRRVMFSRCKRCWGISRSRQRKSI